VARKRITNDVKLKPLVAWRAIRKLFADPDDTGQVFIIISALSGSGFERLFRRVESDEVGGRVITRHPEALLEVLRDRQMLAGLPEGSLGRAYLDFVKTEQLSADGLSQASEQRAQVINFIDPRAETLSTRLRDMHDLWHVVTGYGRDLVGEDALLAFTWAQTRNRGIRLIVFLATLKSLQMRHFWVPAVVRRGRRSGLEAGLLPAQDWEALLTQPLTEVRQQLGVEVAPEYRPVWSDDAVAVRA